MSNSNGRIRRKSVLLVEDNDLYRSSAKALLESFGYCVIAVEDGESAIETFREMHEEIAVVILDVVLPVLSGIDTFLALRSLRSDLPIVLTSGYDQNSVSADFANLEYSGFVSKPDCQNALKDILEKIIVA